MDTYVVMGYDEDCDEWILCGVMPNREDAEELADDMIEGEVVAKCYIEKHYMNIQKVYVLTGWETTTEINKALGVFRTSNAALQHGRALVKEGKIIDFEINTPNLGEFGWI